MEYPKYKNNFITLIKYSAALSGLLNAALIAFKHSSLGNPIEINSSIIFSNSGPDTNYDPGNNGIYYYVVTGYVGGCMIGY